MYGDLQFFDIIVFAVIAVFIIFRLRAVLGKRVGFQKKSNEKLSPEKESEDVDIQIPQLKENEKKLEIVYKKIPTFDHKGFLEGAKKAFEIIISAYNKGDKKTLKNLVAKDVYNAFEKAIDSGLNNPNCQFYSLIIDGVHDAKILNNKIVISVNFISEQILGDNEEQIIKNKDTWVFEKPEKSLSPVWLLIST